MKKLNVMTVLVALGTIGHAWAVPIEVRWVSFLSVAGGESALTVYDGWEQGVVHPTGTASTGGNLAIEGNYLVDPLTYKVAQIGSHIDYFEDHLRWDVVTSLYGQGVGNLIGVSFALSEPVVFEFSLGSNRAHPPQPGLGTGGILGHGTRGVLQAGEYVLAYVDAWNQAGGEEAVYGGFNLAMNIQRVPEAGHGWVLLGMGIAVIAGVRKLQAERRC
jgi:hypothetical protein